MAKNIAVIGDSESIKGFGAIGLDMWQCDSCDDAAQTLRRVADSGRYAIIYMTEELFNCSAKELKRYEDKLTPAILPIPGVKGNNGIGTKRLSAFVEQAVGSDILF